MSNSLRSICKPHSSIFFSSILSSSHQSRRSSSSSSPVISSFRIILPYFLRIHPLYTTPRRTMVVRAAAQWTEERSPYETLELERDGDDEKIKVAYRKLVKFYHPDADADDDDDGEDFKFLARKASIGQIYLLSFYLGFNFHQIFSLLFAGKPNLSRNSSSFCFNGWMLDSYRKEVHLRALLIGCASLLIGCG